jgi:hypothetical protein
LERYGYEGFQVRLSSAFLFSLAAFSQIPVNGPPRSLTERGLENLIAFTRLLVSEVQLEVRYPDGKVETAALKRSYLSGGPGSLEAPRPEDEVLEKGLEVVTAPGG